MMNSELLLLCSLWIIPPALGQGNGAVRLYNNGVTSHTLSAGIVQIYYDGEWGNICNDEAFDLNAASVICRQLSYNGASGYISADATSFGSDPSRSAIEDVTCSSNTYQVLLQCPVQSTYSSTCLNDDNNDVAVTCFTSRTWDDPFSLQLRLQDGDYVTEGRAEVYCSGRWGTVCDDLQITSSYTDIICRQLGYTESTDHRTATGSLLGDPSQPVWLYPLTSSCFLLQTDDLCLANCDTCPQSELTICSYRESIVVSCTFTESNSNDAALTLSTCDIDLTSEDPVDESDVARHTNLQTIIGAAVGAGILFLLAVCVCICCCCCCFGACACIGQQSDEAKCKQCAECCAECGLECCLECADSCWS